MITGFLFAYGSLMRNQAGRRLLGPVRGRTPATVRGHLYHRPAGYPTLVLTPDGDMVEGELLELGRPTETLAQLDRYEGFDPASPDTSDYVRVAHPVRRTESGDAVPAWIYVCPPKTTPDGHRLRATPGQAIRWDRDRPRPRSPP